MEQRLPFKFYYEDTDSLGVVYYANYFKFIERGRTEFLSGRGRSIAELNAAGYLVVVHSLQASFKKPGRLGDVVDVVTSFNLPSVYRGRFHQRIERDGEVLFEATVDVVCLDATQSLIEFPQEIGALAHE